MHSSVDTLLEGLSRGESVSLARAITLLESRRPQDRELQLVLLDGCELLVANNNLSTIRIAVTGAPGVGKSTLINQLGLSLIEEGHRVAVLAIDPSSEATGGSILGDKTRMADLSRNDSAFIRPSPTSGHLGGVSTTTREAILACEAAGYDCVIVETVGVGQSEYQVSHLVDSVLFVTIAGAGDGLQGIKRGILESVDLVAVNKADGSHRDQAVEHARELGGALKLLRGKNAPGCIPTSAVSLDGITALKARLNDVLQDTVSSGRLQSRRQSQRVRWYHDAVKHLVEMELKHRSTWNASRNELQEQVARGDASPFRAAATLVKNLFGTQS